MRAAWSVIRWRVHIAIWPFRRVLLENEITFLSIIGERRERQVEFSGGHDVELRRQLARNFWNYLCRRRQGSRPGFLSRYEETLFLPDNPDRPVFTWKKTRTQGDLYRSVPLGGQETQLPKPFLFTLHPASNHPQAARRNRVGRIVCLYDNAGEHFGVGQDTSLSPVTRHLSQAKVLMFLFDPTQDSAFPPAAARDCRTIHRLLSRHKRCVRKQF